ncbi:MAG: glycosyltransferase family 39 protein [Flavobacteriales bacterium]
MTLASAAPVAGMWPVLAASGSRGSGRSHRRKVAEEAGTGMLTRFRADLRDVLLRYETRTSGPHRRFVLFLILVGTALRAWMLFKPVTYDEAFAYITFATQPFAGIISDYSHPSNHVFHTLLVKLSTGIFGTGLVSMRLPAFIAGVLTMPFFYLFVRGMFNRYIALMALALVASSGGLIEYSALSHGFSITWLCMVVALVLGRHLINENNPVSAVLIGVVCALGAWSVPTMFLIAAMIHIWLFLSLVFKYEQSLRARLVNLLLSLVVFILVALLLYLPVVMRHGLDQLFHHAVSPEHTWKLFTRHYGDEALDLWAYFSDTAAAWIAILGFAGLFQATYISSKYRMLTMGMALGSIPLVMLLAEVGPPRIWLFTLYIFHLSSAIALFYLLKFVQDKMLPGFGKRVRTAGACLLLLLLAVPGMSTIRHRVPRYPEAAHIADYLAKELQPGDHVLADVLWEAPIAFHLMAHDINVGVVGGAPTPGHMGYVAVSKQGDGSMDLVLRYNELDSMSFSEPTMVKEWERMEIFAARYQGH